MRTYTFEDRHPKDPGPWADEPDKAQWIDEATGLDCLMVRNGSGALCGYVGIPPEHPWHGLDYGQCTQKPPCDDSWCDHSPGSHIEVHGGLTFADSCQKGAEDGPGVCHVPEPGRPANVWWFGFDCAHAGDMSPRYSEWGVRHHFRDEVYRTFDYVQSECAGMAAQLKAVAPQAT